MKTVNVKLEPNGYKIYIGPSLNKLGLYLKKHTASRKVIIISNPVVSRWYLKPLKSSLVKHGFKAESILVPDGEKYKSLDRAKILYEQGARFIDTGCLDNFNKFHVNGAIHLPLDYDPERPNATRLKEATITQHVNRDEPVVLYACLWARQSCIPSSWEAAKTVRWGYEKVYWLEERSVDLWVNAGIPIAGSEAARFTEN